MKKAFSIVLLLLLTHLGFSQSYRFEHFKADDGENGIINNKINDIIQDKKGGIWFATQIGATYYNGKDYLHFREGKNKDTLPSSDVKCLMEDSKGNIWFGTIAGVSIYNGIDFKIYEKFNDQVAGSVVTEGAKVISSIIESADGTIWIGTYNSGVYSVQNFKHGEQPIFKKEKKLGDFSITKILETSDGRIWFGHKSGVAVYDQGSIKLLNSSSGLLGKNVSDIIQVSNGDIWVATDRGINIYDGNRFSNPINSSTNLPTDNITCLMEDQDDNVWMGTATKGIIKYNVHTNKFQVYDSNKGLGEDIIDCIIEDKYYNIWVGTVGGGADKLSKVAFSYFGQKEGLGTNYVNDVINPKDGVYWFATRKGAIKIDGKNKTVFNKENGLIVNYINCVFEDSKENIWLGTLAGLVKIVDDKIEKIYWREHNILSPITCIFEDSKGKIWFGTNGSGAWSFDGKNFSQYTIIHGLSGASVTSIVEDKENTIWIGTAHNGLNRLADNVWELYGPKDGLASKEIQSLAIGPRGALYIGTRKGLNKWVSASELYLFNKESSTPLSSNIVKSLIFDEENNLWVGSDKGLDRIVFHPPQVVRQNGGKEPISELRHYGRKEGIKGEINANSACEDVDGNLWFGTNKGAINFNIEVDDYNKNAPETYLTAFTANLGDTILTDWKKSYEVRPFTNVPEGVVLPYSTRSITLSFIGLDLKAPDKVKYTVTIQHENEEEPIIENTKENFYRLNGLQPGTYTITVVGCNSDDECSSEENPKATITFEVQTPWWRQSFFIILMVLIGVSIIYLFIKIREKKLRNERLILEKKVKERTQEVVDKNKELELVNLEIISKNFEIEAKNADLNSSIRYALTIQKASFPAISELTEVFNDSFIYHIPRDIVSGDFYWYKQTGNRFVLAIADCTGHGVPGALTSMIGIALLNEIVGGNKITDPSVILNRLDKGILKAFENSESESNDGMDIGLVTFDFENKTLEFAGAYRPLVFVRAGELEEYKSTKMSIGFKDVQDKEFDKTVIQWETGDCIYLYSDGYADQFGGPNNKKFKTKIMKQMLLDSSHKPMNTQMEIVDERFIAWMGPTEQVDDILVCGIRLP